MKTIYLGQCRYGEHIVAQLNDDNTVKRFVGYDLIYPDQSYDNNYYKYECSCSSTAEFEGHKLRADLPLPLDLPLVSEEDAKRFEDAIDAYGSNCSECGLFHDTEQYGKTSFFITSDGDFCCKGCVGFEEMLTELTDTNKIFKAKDMTGVSIPKEWIEVEKLFCDVSGMGSVGEAAYTKEKITALVEGMLFKSKDALYCGITGIGQFQVYVSIYRKKAIRAKKAKSKAA